MNPRATYRLQLGGGFGFREAAEIVGYLAALGISHVYLSPVLQAAAGSTHGYDASDLSLVSRELGGEEAALELMDKLSEHGMSSVIDIVPNHLSATADSPWWWDVLENGSSSEHARAFDIEWSPADPGYRGKVVLPVLGDHIGRVLERNEIVIDRDQSPEPVLRYHEHVFPLNPESVKLAAGNSPDIAAILAVQAYALIYWRAGSEELNYRRFFAINNLAALRVDERELFEKVHETWFRLAEKGNVGGFRVDHPDGLRDPAGYMRMLRERAPDAWLVVEKILEPGEELPGEWPVEGTTGYDFIQRAGGLFIDPRGEESLSEFYAEFVGARQDYPSLIGETKRKMISSLFGCDLRRLVEHLRRVCRHPEVRLDYPRATLGRVLTDLLAAFPVYRTYVVPGNDGPSAGDREVLDHAFSYAKGGEDEALYKLLEGLLTGGSIAGEDGAEFVARFQQLTGPVMAKGVEDTAFYRYNRLIALNEVGCDPSVFGVTPESFHELSVRSQRKWPLAMLGSSTHDTKRSEDVRARLALLSEIPDRWAGELRHWSAINSDAWGDEAPDRNAEYYFYQTVVGAWPADVERIRAHMNKACREAAVHTSWTAIDEAYENKIRSFIETTLADPVFSGRVELFVALLQRHGRSNSLAQLLLKLTAPGVPDIYQGSELWDDSLTDPDNRRPVDFEKRKKLIARLDSVGPDQGDDEDPGVAKMHVIRQSLKLREKRPECFGAGEEGRYTPLHAEGGRADHVIAYLRGDSVAVVVPRLVMGLTGGWGDTCLTFSGNWINLLDGKPVDGSCRMGDLFANFPVALMERTDNS